MKTNTTNTTIETNKTNTMPNLKTDDRIFADFTSESLVSIISHLHYALAIITGYMNEFKRMKRFEKDPCDYAVEYDYNKNYYDDIRCQSHDFFKTIGSYETLIMNLEKAECAALNCDHGIYMFYKVKTDTPLPLKLKGQRRQYDCDVLHVTSHLKEYLKGVISELECTDRESYLYRRLTANLKQYKYSENYESLIRALKIAERCMR
jgi:hypothetical protein